MDARYFKVGDFISCEYNGKARPSCEVTEIPYGRDYIQVRTADGYRNFKFHKIANLKTLKLATS